MFKKISFFILILGSIFDEVSTRCVLSLKPIYENGYITYFYEANKFTNMLISLKLWFVFDVVLNLIIIILMDRILNHWDFKNKNVILIFPILVGLFRLGFSIKNFELYFRYI